MDSTLISVTFPEDKQNHTTTPKLNDTYNKNLFHTEIDLYFLTTITKIHDYSFLFVCFK